MLNSSSVSPSLLETRAARIPGERVHVNDPRTEDEGRMGEALREGKVSIRHI